MYVDTATQFNAIQTSTKKTVKEILDFDVIAVDKSIFFAVEFDENNEVVLGCGNCDLLDKN